MNKTEYLRETIDLTKAIETRFLELGKRLYKIREEKLWLDSYNNYTEFLDTARINPAMASMLVSVYKGYVIEGGKDEEELRGIGYSNLYESLPLIESDGVNKALNKAKTLPRSDIKDEVRAMRHGEHTHDIGTRRFGVCACGKFIEIHGQEKANQS